MLVAIAATLAAQALPAPEAHCPKLKAKLAEAVTLDAPMQKAPVYPGGEYKSIGTGIMTDDMLTGLLDVQPVSYNVEIQQSVADPNFYRVMAPYGKAFVEAMEKVNNMTFSAEQYDSEGVCYIDICATDPNDVYFPATKTGIVIDGIGDLYIGINSSYNVTLKDGMFTAPMMGVAVAYKNDEGNLVGQAFNRRGKFLIALPGVQPFDYALALSEMPTCVTSRTITGTLTRGADVAKVNYHVVPNWQEDEIMSAVREIAQYGNEWTMDNQFSYTMSMNDKETLIAVALDAAGNTVGYDWKTYYYIDDYPDGWTDEGDAVWHEGMMGDFFPVLTPESLPCKMQRSKDRPQFFRLVNPMASHSRYAQGKANHEGHNHYIYINAEDPECIYLEESPVGLDFGHGAVRFSSAVKYYLDAGFELQDCKDLEMGATIADGKLTFPAESLIISMLGYDNGDWYTVADPSQTWLELPKDFNMAGVNDIVADASGADEAPVYYNLQGMRIKQPQPGTLCIERRGQTARKVLVH